MRLAAPCLSLGILLAVALALPAPRATADDLPATSEFFDEYDRDGDGKVTPEEFQGASEIFRLLDKNADGVISPDDLGLPADYKPDPKRRRAGAPEGKGPRPNAAEDARRQFRQQLERMDADKDGRVSKAEWQGDPAAFDRFDRNKDGFLDAQDRPRSGERGERGKGGKGGKDGKKGPPPGDGPGMPGPEGLEARVKEQFARFDKNQDGRLTAEEMPNPALLGAADGDKDGAVTLEEFTAFAKARMGGGRPAPEGDRRRGRFNAGMLRRWDRDDDGKVSREEFPGRDDAFERFDTNKDGFLTPEDLATDRRPDVPKKGDAPAATDKAADPIAAQDTDGDGKLNRAEFKGSAEAWRTLDKNGDGWITRDELPK